MNANFVMKDPKIDERQQPIKVRISLTQSIPFTSTHVLTVIGPLPHKALSSHRRVCNNENATSNGPYLNRTEPNKGKAQTH